VTGPRPRVDVLIPTLRRPESLARAVRSVLAQSALGRVGEIIIIDNDPVGSAKDGVDALAATAPVRLHYVHEPTPGVATARNAGLKVATAPLIAFLDDDEEASPHWLNALLETQAGLDADAVFGPIQTRLPDSVERDRAFLERFFARVGPAKSGLIDDGYGCGNSLLKRATALPGPSPFETEFDQTGGEDDRLFADLKQRGGRLAWAADALAYEHAPEHRATRRYALSRAFAYGQGPAQTCAQDGDWFGVARWTVIGFGQLVVYGLRAVALQLVGRSPVEAMDRATRGLGKMFWMRRPTFYGQTEVRRLSAIGGS
jgi:succinoglycan biosynthesis protein ExoM